jgi:hypothetical protein
LSDIKETSPRPRGSGFALDVRVHDAAHLEWEVGAALPPTGETVSYRIDMTVEVPESVWAPHDPWARFWARSRLQAPGRGALEDTIDLPAWVLATVRDGKSALTAARKGWRAAAKGIVSDEALTELRARTAEHLGAAARRLTEVPPAEVIARGTTHPGARPVDEVAAEARLYLAGRSWTEFSETLLVLERLAKLQPRLGALRPDLVAHIEAAIDAVQTLERFVLSEERERERFLRRMGDLKRAFHRRLYLDAVIVDADKRYGHVVAAFVAIIASSWAFAWQVAVFNQIAGNAITGPALLSLGAMVGVIYAVKDRIKEIGRRWVSGWVRTSYADRVVKLFLRPDTDPKRSQILRSRETIRVSTRERADGSRFHVLDVTLRLDLQGRAAPRALGIDRVKHILRYDFADMLVGLERAPHMLAVPAPQGALRIIEVDKTYEVPCVCSVTPNGGEARTWRGTLHVSERGLETLERKGQPPNSVKSELT